MPVSQAILRTPVLEDFSLDKSVARVFRRLPGFDVCKFMRHGNQCTLAA